jgi:hypothetical protein
LCHETGVVGDVWLYNVVETPAEPPWSSDGARANDPPFPNSRAFGRDDIEVPRVRSDGANVEVRAVQGQIDVMVDGALAARLARGATPGWSVMASADGPCARRLHDHSNG